MKWFRKHLKHGSRLALFALAIQFGLSFGHFHAVTAQAAPAIATGLAQADADHANGLASQETSREAAKAQQPSSPDTDHAADPCAICAVISLANNVLFAIAAAVATAAGGRTSVPDHRRRVRSFELAAFGVPVPRPSRLLTSIG